MRWGSQDGVKLQHHGLLRMVRDAFHISGFLVFDALSQIIEIVLNRSAPLAPTLLITLPELLTPVHVAISLGETEVIRKGNIVMFLQHKKLVLGGVMLVLFLLLVACGSARSESTGTSSTQNWGSIPSATAATTITPHLVTPKAARGSAGKGPLVISSPTPVPGGKAGSQQIVLGDRTLIINSVSKQKGASTNSTLINLDLAVHNTSNKAIINQSTFFQLMGPEGDTFGYQYTSSDNIYGTIAAHMTRSGTIVFQVPTAVLSSLHLLYRPEIATDTAIVLLKVS